jgi:endonuclease/exonuclease/phosphatase family metal-dependent hydrolase
MKRVSLLLGVCVLSVSLPLLADEPQVGDTVELKASHHLGVPLHSDPDPPFDDFERVADAALAEILEIRDGGRWNRIRVESDARDGWVVERYILRVVENGGGPPSADERESEIWQSGQACETALSAGARMRRTLDSPIVVGTWNIRWFPRGCPRQEDCPESATDLDWLACTIAWMGMDVLALQEILDTPDARTALGLLTQRLAAHTGGTWESDLQECGTSSAQHVGFLWNASRVTLSNRSDEEQLNGASAGPDACAGNLRPGRYARVTSQSADGVDFHLLSVHLDSGRNQRDFDNRRAAIAELPVLEIGGRPLTEIGDPPDNQGDNDILVVGDYNTMGMGSPTPVTEEQELVVFDQELAPGFARLALNLQCSEYFRPSGASFEGGLLDHVVAAQGMEEIASTARLTGYCAVVNCQDFTTPPRAYEVLSDHCPLVTEVRDEDRDGE